MYAHKKDDQTTIDRLAKESPEIRFALQATRSAALLVRSIQASMAHLAVTKEDRSPVTVADFSAQALVGYLIDNHLPGEVLVAEEDASTLQRMEHTGLFETIKYFLAQEIGAVSAKNVLAWIDRGAQSPGARFWCLDPIDGTKGFLRGDQYAVALSLIEDGEVLIGALGCPNLRLEVAQDLTEKGSLLLAVRHHGCWATSLEHPAQFVPLHVSEVASISAARLLRSYEGAHTNTSQIAAFTHTLHIQTEPIAMDSQAKYALLASGGAEILLRLLSPDKPEYREKIWDQAAGALILEEAGGLITDLDGKRLDFTTGRKLLHNRGILATNGKLHDRALEALQKLGL